MSQKEMTLILCSLSRVDTSNYKNLIATLVSFFSSVCLFSYECIAFE